MVNYFKELENPNDFYLDLIDTRQYGRHNIDINYLPSDFLKSMGAYLKK